jgi:hypothetical protein
VAGSGPSGFGFFGYIESVVDIDPKVTNRTLELRVAEH